MSPRVQILSGGHGHDFGETTAALGEILAARRVTVTIETDFAKCVHRLGETDLLVVNALRWSMTQHEKYAPFRAAFAFDAPAREMEDVAAWVRGGGRLLAMHTAVICFDTRPVWLEVLGGGWRWGVSHHPPLGPLQVAPTDAEAFDLFDEAYHQMSPAVDVEIRATCALAEGVQPIAWTRRWGEGRVAVDTLGHDRRSLETPAHARLIGRLLDWLAEA